MMDTIKKFISTNSFNGSFISIFFNPFYFARKELYKSIKNFSKYFNNNVLDIGCGNKPYKHLFEKTNYLGIDVNQSGHSNVYIDADLFYDGKTMPFADSEFDHAVSFQVLEHVFEPEAFLNEIHRVLKPNGYFLLTIPFVWDEHEKPYDYARYSSFGIKYLLDKNGFNIIEQRKTANNITAVFQLLNCYIFKKTETSSGLLNLIFTFILIMPFNFTGLMLNWLLPINDDFYIDNVILAQKK